MAKRYRLKSVLNRGYYEAIGRAIVYWAALEIRFDEQLLRMLAHPKAASFRTEKKIQKLDHIKKAFHARLGLVREIAEIHYSGDTLARFEQIIDKCESIRTDRDRLAHSQWVFEYSRRFPGRLVSYANRYGTRIKPRILPLPKVRQITHAIGDVYADLDQFMYQHHPSGPLSKRLREQFAALVDSRTRASPSPTPE